MMDKKEKASVMLSEDGSSLVLLDQTLLPGEEKYLYLKTAEEIWEAIHSLRVRGAPAIGIAAAYGIYVILNEEKNEIDRKFKEARVFLESSRPTAVNLSWALERMQRCMESNAGKSVLDIKEALRREADDIRQEDEDVCRAIGINGLTLLSPKMGILTHCNAGGIATARYGTALAPVYLGSEKGYSFKVFADETRPLMQGARLTVWELMKHGIDVTLICDSAAATVMSKGWIDAVLVGCDRVAMNGDTANKIGTKGVAILAKEFSIPFYVCCPLSTIDKNMAAGKDIVIEERPGEEIYKRNFIKQTAPDDVKTFNPAFDVTDNRYISAIVTEKGIIRHPYEENLKRIL